MDFNRFVSWARPGAVVLSAFGLIAALPAASADPRRVETGLAVIKLSPTSGDLVGLEWKSPTLEIIREPRLGENFRVLVPKPGQEASYFNSRDQKVDRIEELPGGVACYYNSLRNAEEELPVKIRYRIQAAGRQVLFSIEIDNPTVRKVAEVYYGILGGLRGIGDRRDTETLIPSGSSNLATSLFQRFQPGAYGGGNLGIRYDATAFTYPGSMVMGWMDVYNRKTNLGFYYANQDPAPRLTALNVELRPFTKAASVDDNWPAAEDVPEGEPIGLTMGWINFPHAAKGRLSLGPVALQVHAGDWHTASGIYRKWFDRNFSVKREPSWLRKEMAWQSVIIGSPEDTVVHRFRDLPGLAAAAKKYGVTTFEILGWDIGGIDRGYPQYTPDPRLGSPQEFRDALAGIRAMGVHPVIFSNIQFADTATGLFRKHLSRYAVQGRWAPDWPLFGWGESTIGARLGLTRSNMTLISPSHPEVRKLLLSQYLELIREGAEGLQLDKTLVVSSLDFNPALPVSPDRSLFEGVLTTFRELLTEGRRINPRFALASEIWIDRALPYVDVSYFRLGTIDMNSTAFRYTFPEWTATIFGESPGDFNPMNNGMRYGLVWALAPRHYNDSIDEPLTRPLARYVQELIRIRQKYRDLLFHGRFNDTMGATVDGEADIRYSVFKPMSETDGSRAAVVVNYGDREEKAQLDFSGKPGSSVEISTPFEPDRKATLPIRLRIPPRRCVVAVVR